MIYRLLSKIHFRWEHSVYWVFFLSRMHWESNLQNDPAYPIEIIVILISMKVNDISWINSSHRSFHQKGKRHFVTHLVRSRHIFKYFIYCFSVFVTKCELLSGKKNTHILFSAEKAHSLKKFDWYLLNNKKKSRSR